MDKVLTLSDGVEVEIEISEDEAHLISNNSEVDSSIENLKELLQKVLHPFASTYRELDSLGSLESAKVKIGVKIGVEGNFFLAKSSAGANIELEIIFGASE